LNGPGPKARAQECKVEFGVILSAAFPVILSEAKDLPYPFDDEQMQILRSAQDDMLGGWRCL
jgi:hypothetical protein